MLNWVHWTMLVLWLSTVMPSAVASRSASAKEGVAVIQPASPASMEVMAVVSSGMKL